MLRIGDSVVITSVYNSALSGRTGAIIRIFRNQKGSVVYGVKVDEVPNPKSKYDTFWFSESEVCKIYPSYDMPNSTEKTITEVIDGMDEDEKKVMHFMVQKALESTQLADSMRINKVIYNPPATIVLWADGSKTVVKCSKYDDYDAEKGLAMALCKKMFGNDNSYHKIFKKHIPEKECNQLEVIKCQVKE